MKLLYILLIFLFSSFYFLPLSQNNFELYAIRYGESLFSTENIFNDTEENTKVPFSWLFYVLKIKEKIILIDTGFSDLEKQKKYNIDFTNPIKTLEKINIKPDQVTDVILTHSHFDHIGNVDKFKNAKIYIAQNELAHFLKNTSENKNIVTFDNEINFFDFIKIKEIGGHTKGSSVIYIYDKDKNYVLTGDECYLIENCSQARPIGTFNNYAKNKAFVKMISQDDRLEILTFHDPKIFEKYEKINDWVVKIK